MKIGGIVLAWVGVAVLYAGGIVYHYALTPIISGVILAIMGCALWALGKKRSPVYGLWGILAPIGLLGVSLLKDKTN